MSPSSGVSACSEGAEGAAGGTVSTEQDLYSQTRAAEVKPDDRSVAAERNIPVAALPVCGELRLIRAALGVGG